MGRYCHDRAGTVRDQHIVGNPDGNPVAVDGIDGVSAGKDAGLFIVESGSVEALWKTVRSGWWMRMTCL